MCINRNCKNKVIRDNEYASLGLDRENAFNNGFSICGKCAREKFFVQNPNQGICCDYDEKQFEESL